MVSLIRPCQFGDSVPRAKKAQQSGLGGELGLQAIGSSRALMTQLKEEVLHTLRERWDTALARQAKEAEGRLAEIRR